MSMTTLSIPANLNMPLVRQFITEAEKHANDPSLNLDFAGLTFSYPLATLVAGRYIRDLVLRRKVHLLPTMATGVTASIPAHSFLMHIGFFKFINLPVGKAPGEAEGSSSYVPIRCVTRPSASTSVSDACDREAIALARVLTGHAVYDSDNDIAAYTLREVLRNVFEHSTASECYVAAQRWRTGEVQIAVIDEGIGVRASLGRVRDLSTDGQALSAAVLPGVTCAGPGTDNSGYGLYVLSELGRNYGFFEIGSGNTSLSISRGSRDFHDIVFAGTFVGLSVQGVQNFSYELERIVSAGERAAAVLGTVAHASYSSRRPPSS